MVQKPPRLSGPRRLHMAEMAFGRICDDAAMRECEIDGFAWLGRLREQRDVL